jgi:hypothetical protein
MSLRDNLLAVGIDPAVANILDDWYERADALASAGVVNNNGGTVTVAEQGDGTIHKSIFNLTAAPVTLTDDAGAGQWAALKLYDFPAGNIVTLGAVIDAALTLNEAWWQDNAPGDVGLGTAATTDGTTLAAAEQNIAPTTAITASAQIAPLDTQSTGVGVSGAAGGTDADGVLNIRIDDQTAHMPDVVTNGAFTTDTGWTKGTGWTVDAANSNTAASDGSQTAASDLEQAVAFVAGVTYKTVFDVTRSAGSVRLSIGGTLGTARSSGATFTENIVAGSDGVLAVVADADFVGTIDNLVVTPLTGTGTVTGTVTVAWINTGDF